MIETQGRADRYGAPSDGQLARSRRGRYQRRARWMMLAWSIGMIMLVLGIAIQEGVVHGLEREVTRYDPDLDRYIIYADLIKIALRLQQIGLITALAFTGALIVNAYNVMSIRFSD